MEAILAYHPALLAKWLDWVAKWCELWRMHTGSIDPSSRAAGQLLLQAWRYVRLADPGPRSLRYYTENSSAFWTICIFILVMAMVRRTIAILDNHWWLGQSQRTLTLLVYFWEKSAQVGVPVKTPKKTTVQSQSRYENFWRTPNVQLAFHPQFFSGRWRTVCFICRWRMVDRAGVWKI